MDIRFLRVFHALFVLLVHVSQGFTVNIEAGNAPVKCKERERQALLALKQGFVDQYNWLSSWKGGENQKECCKWEGVQCSNRTGHVVKLDLRSNIHKKYLAGTITPSLAELNHLNYLDLSCNYFDKLSHIPKFIGSLTHLRYLNLSSIHVQGKITYELGDLFRLQFLDLSWNFFSGIIPPSLGNLSSLQYIDLSSYHNGGFGEVIRSLRSNLEWVSHLRSLQSLKLSGVDLSTANRWVQQVSYLSHLQELDFNYCNIINNAAPWFFATININSSSLAVVDLSNNNLTFSVFPWLLSYSGSLTVLRLNGNHLTGPIPEAFGNFSFLLELSLAKNHLEGEIPKSLLDICSLRRLYLYENNLSGQLEDVLATSGRCANILLQDLHLSNNRIIGSLPNISQFSLLKKLYLDSNELNGSLSSSIGQLSNLEELNIGDNSLRGVISKSHFLRLSKLRVLDLSFNELVFNISNAWIPPFKLKEIRLASCKLGPTFPRWLQNQNIYSYLDISSAGISDTIPSWFWDFPPLLQSLNLSHNRIRGKISSLPLKVFGSMQIDLNSNLFEGLIPSNLTFLTRSLDLSDNKFTDANIFLCPNMTTNLAFLDLSNNELFGELPNCWRYFKSLAFLSLANNNFYGEIPTSLGFLRLIQAFHFDNNRFMGEIPLSLNKCTELRVFNAVQNNLSGLIPSWIGDGLKNLVVLSLRSNQFYGSLTSSICHLSKLQILDLSLNNFSGSIPRCLNNLTALASQANSNATITHYFDESLVNQSSLRVYFDDSVSLIWKGKESKYRNTLGLLRSIDLSSNMLIGEIPSEIMDLIGLVSLNISRNMINGEIPSAIGRLKSLDFLDLSRNHLSGKIPSEFSQLDRLSVLDLSYNNLSGEIPISTQLQSFDASAYTRNVELCGAPLSKCPDKEKEDDQNGKNNEDDEQIFGQGFYISLTIGFSIGFWGVCNLLFFKKSWRYAYFKFFSDAYDNLYVMAAINMAKFGRRIRAST